MAGNLGELIQMIATLSGVKAQKRKLDLDEAQLAEQASQFAQQGEEQKFAAALKVIAGSSAKSREGLGQLISTLSPEHRAAAEALVRGQPIDPTVLHAEDIQAGRAAMPAQQLATIQNESAVQNATGMNVGGLGASQLQGTIAAGATPMVTPAMQQAAAERAATGRDPITAAVQTQQMAGGMVPAMAQIAGGLRQSAGQAATTGLGYANLNFNFAQLEQNERQMAANYGLDKMLKTAEANHYMSTGGSGGGAGGGLTGAQWVEGMRGMSNILNDINSNKSDEAGNMARRRVFNATNEVLGRPLPPLPVSGPDAPGKVPLLEQLRRGMMGGPTVMGPSGGAAMPWPSMTPTFGGQP